MNTAHVGVSGFSYPTWKGRFYPKDVKNEDFLTYYSHRLDSVEINSSFYASPRAATVENWSLRARAKFTFSFKAPQQVTHIHKLGKGSAEAALRFSKIVDSLGAKRGPILYQLPPYSKQDFGLLDEFLSATAGSGTRVFEFRHNSWFQAQTYQLLERHGAGFCIADTEASKPTFQVTGGLAYFRLRKEAYDPSDMDRWAEQIRDASSGSRETYAYLKHDETGENAILAQRLADNLAAER